MNSNEHKFYGEILKITKVEVMKKSHLFHIDNINLISSCSPPWGWNVDSEMFQLLNHSLNVAASDSGSHFNILTRHIRFYWIIDVLSDTERMFPAQSSGQRISKQGNNKQHNNDEK